MSTQSQTLNTYSHPSVQPTNRRATVRYLCAPATLGKVFRGAREDFLRAYVINLSREGAGLLVPKPMSVGLRMLLQITSPTTNEKFEFETELIHCTQEINGDWTVGCRFVHPLSYEQLEQLL